jgi:anti-anti-sigma regulatory factor
VDILLSGVDALERICASDPEINEEFIQTVLARIGELRDGKPSPPKPSATAAPPIPTPVESRIVLPSQFGDQAAEAVRKKVCDLLAQTPSHIRMDFSAVEEISVSAMSLLLSIARQIKNGSPPMVVEVNHAAPSVRSLLRVVGLESAFALRD